MLDGAKEAFSGPPWDTGKSQLQMRCKSHSSFQAQIRVLTAAQGKKSSTESTFAAEITSMAEDKLKAASSIEMDDARTQCEPGKNLHEEGGGRKLSQHVQLIAP